MKVTNRKEIEDLVYGVFQRLDPSGVNVDRYKEFFNSMSDTEFAKWLKEFLKNDHENFTLDVIEFENHLNMNDCEKAAKFLGIPLFEHVYFPHLTMDKKNVIVSKEPCLVSYVNIKRTQQLLHKKNALSKSADKTSVVTGQVVQKDKNARVNDMEGSMLVALGADKLLKEMYGPRADDHVMKNEMNQEIANKGYVELDDLTDISTNKVTLNTVNDYLLGMGLKSDIVTDSYYLPKETEKLAHK